MHGLGMQVPYQRCACALPVGAAAPPRAAAPARGRRGTRRSWALRVARWPLGLRTVQSFLAWKAQAFIDKQQPELGPQGTRSSSNHRRAGPTPLRPLPFAGSHGGHLTGTRTSDSESESGSGGDSAGAHGAAAQPWAGANAAVTTSDSSALKRARAERWQLQTARLAPPR